MKRFRTLFCGLLAALLIPAALTAARELPFRTKDLIGEKYAGWSGVLRIWIYEGWENGAGSFAGWLNRCAAGFEKRHGGVYVQTRSVDAAAIRDFLTTGVRPPDMILFPPGLLTDAEGLTTLTAPAALLPGLRDCGGGRAMPVALGGYAWAVNRNKTDRLPVDRSKLATAAPPDGSFTSFSAALLALCTGTAEEPEALFPMPGPDLGLSIEETPSPTIPPSAAEPILNEDFAFRETAFSDFINGRLDAVIVTQAHIVRLKRLSEQGKGPDWTILSDGTTAFTDQLLLLGVVDGDEERAALCREFAGHLLSEDCQRALSDCGAFSVLTTPTGYSPTDPMAVIDATFRGKPLVVPDAFGGNWRENAAWAALRLIEGTIRAGDAVTELFPEG